MSNKTSDRHAQPPEGGFKPTERKRVATEPSIQAQGLNTRALGHNFLFAAWRSVLWRALLVVLTSFLAIVGEAEHRPMNFFYAFFLGGAVGGVHFVFQPKGEELRAFGLTTAQIRRLATAMWGMTIPASALYLLIVAVISRGTGGMLSSGRLLLSYLVGYLLVLAYAVYWGWSAQVEIRNDAVGEQNIAVRAERAKEQKGALSFLGIGLVGALIGGRWLLTTYGLPKNYVQWLAFGGSRRAWRRAALVETVKTSWSVPLAILLIGYPALLNGGSALREQFSGTEILAGAPMLGLIVLFLILGTTLVTALATWRWPKVGALTLGGFLAYGMAMVAVFCFQLFFTGDVDPLPRAAIGVLISAFFAVMAAWVFCIRILKQDARNASHIQTLGE